MLLRATLCAVPRCALCACRSMTEEERLRLAVRLSNCFMARSTGGTARVQRCTDSMSVRQCTEGMDDRAFMAYTQFHSNIHRWDGACKGEHATQQSRRQQRFTAVPGRSAAHFQTPPPRSLLLASLTAPLHGLAQNHSLCHCLAAATTTLNAPHCHAITRRRSICLFLQNEDFRRQTEDLINDLHRSTRDAHGTLRNISGGLAAQATQVEQLGGAMAQVRGHAARCQPLSH